LFSQESSIKTTTNICCLIELIYTSITYELCEKKTIYYGEITLTKW
jgi:hypothetical protein